MHALFALIGIATNLLSLSHSAQGKEPSSDYCLEAVVCHVINIRQAEQMELSLLDHSGPFSLRINTSEAPYGIIAGDILSISGKVGKTSAVFRHTGPVTRTGHVTPPDPMFAPADEILTGKHDDRMVRTCGLLRNVIVSELNPHWTWIVLKVGGQNLYAAAPNDLADIDKLRQLLHKDVELVGMVLPQDGSFRHRVGRILHFNGIADIRTTARSGSNPFSAPELSTIGNLPPAEVSKLPRHRLTGRVLAVWNGKSALVTDTHGTPCRVEFSSERLPSCGDLIDILGYPESDLHYLNLSDAIWRSAHAITDVTNSVVEPVDIRLDEVFRLGMQPCNPPHGRFVRLKGTVVALPAPIVLEQLLFIKSQSQVIPVNAGSTSGAFDNLQIGSELEVSGIFIMDIDNYRPSLLFPRVNGAMLVLRTADDIRILAQPSWWTPDRLTAVICGLAALLLGILIWNISLNRIATRKSRALLNEQIGHVKAELKTEERTRLAVELHDSLAQSLTGVSLELDTAEKLIGEDIPAMRTHMRNAARSLKSCRDELRNCLWDLRNRALEETTMDAAIRQTLAPHVAGIDLAIRFDVPRERISDNTAHAILRIIRELTLNGIRHGNASKIRVAGSIEGDRMYFSVRDNGIGFDPSAAPGFSEGHYGLMGIQERIDEFEGEFKINSVPGKGTKVTIALAVPQETEENA